MTASQPPQRRPSRSPRRRLRPALRARATTPGARARVAGVSLALALSGLAGPAAGQAAIVTFGSTLAPSATIKEAHGADAAFWPLALDSGGTVQAPASGQIVAVRLKGTAIPNTQPGAPAPLTQVHFQDLRPQPDGSVVVIVTTGGFNVPVNNGSNSDTVSTFQPVNFCVQQGDFVDFNDEGGFNPNYYPQGVPFQVFGAARNSVTNFFTKDAGTMNGARFTGAPNRGEELLLQMDLATGPDATPLCPGGGGSGAARGAAPAANSSTTGTSASSVFVPSQTDLVHPNGGFTASVICHATTACSGTATVSSPPTAGVARRRKPIHFSVSAPFSVGAGQTGQVVLRLPPRAARMVRKRRRARATLSATGVSGATKTTDQAAIRLRRGKR